MLKTYSSKWILNELEKIRSSGFRPEKSGAEAYLHQPGKNHFLACVLRQLNF